MVWGRKNNGIPHRSLGIGENFLSCCLLAVWLLARHLILLKPQFFIDKMEVIILVVVSESNSSQRISAPALHVFILDSGGLCFLALWLANVIQHRILLCSWTLKAFLLQCCPETIMIWRSPPWRKVMMKERPSHSSLPRWVHPVANLPVESNCMSEPQWE